MSDETIDLDSMTKDELIAEAEARGIEVPSGALKADVRALLDADSGDASGTWVPGDQAPFTPPVPQTGEGDMTSSPQPTNEPSVPSVELPASVHKNSGGIVGPRERIG